MRTATRTPILHTVCKLHGCDNKHYASGLCKGHWTLRYDDMARRVTELRLAAEQARALAGMALAYPGGATNAQLRAHLTKIQQLLFAVCPDPWQRPHS